MKIKLNDKILKKLHSKQNLEFKKLILDVTFSELSLEKIYDKIR